MDIHPMQTPKNRAKWSSLLTNPPKLASFQLKLVMNFFDRIGTSMAREASLRARVKVLWEPIQAWL